MRFVVFMRRAWRSPARIAAHLGVHPWSSCPSCRAEWRDLDAALGSCVMALPAWRRRQLSSHRRMRARVGTVVCSGSRRLCLLSLAARERRIQLPPRCTVRCAARPHRSWSRVDAAVMLMASRGLMFSRSRMPRSRVVGRDFDDLRLFSFACGCQGADIDDLVTYRNSLR